MADHKATVELHRAKIIASGCMKKTEAIRDIKDSWEIEEGEHDHFESIIIDIGLQCEYAITIFDEIVDSTERLLHNPPPYEANPDERRHRFLELQVLAGLALEHAGNLRMQVTELKEDVIDGALIRLTETERRALTVETDAEKLKTLTLRLVDGDRGQAARGDG